jgi:hypothetical protein
MLKKSRFVVAVTLLVQSLTFFVLFCVLWGKKKSLAGAFLSVAAMGGATGAYLIMQMKKEIAETSVEFDDDFEVDEVAFRSDLDRMDDEEPLEA